MLLPGRRLNDISVPSARHWLTDLDGSQGGPQLEIKMAQVLSEQYSITEVMVVPSEQVMGL